MSARRRIRSRVATVAGGGAPGSGNPAGSSLTVDSIGMIEILYSEAALATPVDAATFLLNVATADTMAAPTDAVTLLDIVMGTGEIPSPPYSAQQIEASYVSTTTWTCPPGVYYVYVECYGAGGGAMNATATQSGTGGGGGAYAASWIAVVPGTTYTVTVGVGGNNGVSGTSGGDSWFSTAATVMAQGGKNGGVGTGGLASASFGTVKFNGGNGFAPALGAAGGGGGGGAGQSGAGSSATSATGGAGGSGGGGAGGTGGAAVTGGVGTNGSIIGGGGGGGGFSATSPGAGADGARGSVHLTFDVHDPNTLVLNDSFDRANTAGSLGNADSGQTWTNEAEHAGVWNVVSNGAQHTADDGVGNRSNATSIDVGTPNYRYTAVVDVGNSPGIAARGIVGGDCAIRVRADVTNNAYFANKRIGGVDTFLGTWVSSGVTGGIHILTLECYGDKVRFYLDGVLRQTYTIPAADLVTLAGAQRVQLWSTFGDFSSYKSVTAHAL